MYVGHICTRIPDDTIRELLAMCGPVVKWARQPDPITGKWIHFGYCEFASLEGVWRALELLDGRQLGSKTLTVRCEARVQKKVDEFIYHSKPDQNKQRRIQATIDALLTAANQTWRDQCLITDPLKKPSPPETTAQTVQYRMSKAEISRNKRRADQAARDDEEFKWRLREWRKEEEKRAKAKVAEMNEDLEKLEKKFRRIEKDGRKPRRNKVDVQAELLKDMEEQEPDDTFQAFKVTTAAVREELDVVDEPKTVSTRESAPARLEEHVIYDLVSKVPVGKYDVMSYKIDTHALLANESTASKYRSWLKGKLYNLIGESNEDLVDMILLRIQQGSSLRDLIDFLRQVIDEEAEKLSVRLWKLFIFESLVVCNT